jgi:hypothetical protein
MLNMLGQFKNGPTVLLHFAIIYVSVGVIIQYHRQHLICEDVTFLDNLACVDGLDWMLIAGKTKIATRTFKVRRT